MFIRAHTTSRREEGSTFFRSSRLSPLQLLHESSLPLFSCAGGKSAPGDPYSNKVRLFESSAHTLPVRLSPPSSNNDAEEASWVPLYFPRSC